VLSERYAPGKMQMCSTEHSCHGYGVNFSLRSKISGLGCLYLKKEELITDTKAENSMLGHQVNKSPTNTTSYPSRLKLSRRVM
jgi:hypothetical protein